MSWSHHHDLDRNVIEEDGELMVQSLRRRPECRLRGVVNGRLGFGALRFRNQLKGSLSREGRADDYGFRPHNAVSTLMVGMVVRVDDKLNWQCGAHTDFRKQLLTFRLV